MADARSVCSESRTPLVYLHAQLGRWARGGVRVNNGTGAMHVHRVAPARRDVRVGSGAVYVVPLFCGPITISRSILPLGRQLCKGTCRRSTCLICPASPPPPSLLPLPRPHLPPSPTPSSPSPSPSGLLHPPPSAPNHQLHRVVELLFIRVSGSGSTAGKSDGSCRRNALTALMGCANEGLSYPPQFSSLLRTVIDSQSLSLTLSDSDSDFSDSDSLFTKFYKKESVPKAISIQT